MVNEVNAVSEELDKHKGFEIVLLSEEAQEGNNRETKYDFKMFPKLLSSSLFTLNFRSSQVVTFLLLSLLSIYPTTKSCPSKLDFENSTFA